MHQALYRKWRPTTFDEVYGQNHITSVLKYECENNKLSHAYLFCGSRGTGKTTCAKILAKAVNCENPIGGNPCGKCPACLAIENEATTDVLEMDAASNNGVDNIRDIREEVVYLPSMLKYRVYIVDEVHMLSGSAFNALLKTLEEPPSHVIFILATTELNKLPTTIISRCQRFDFRRISIPTIKERLSEIANAEKIEMTDDAASLIAKLALGGMRDAVSLLELCAGGGERVTSDKVSECTGVSSRDSICRVVRAIAEKDYDVIFSEVNDVVSSSKDIAVFWSDILSFYRDMLVMKTSQNAEKYLDLTESEAKQTKETADLFKKETLVYHCKMLDSTYYSIQKAGSAKRLCAEMALIRMCDETLDSSNEAILRRIADVEDKLLSGSFTSSAPKISGEELDRALDTAIKEKPKRAYAPAKKSEQEENLSEEKPKQQKRSLSYWAEAVEKICRDDPMIQGFLTSSKTYKNEVGKIVIRLDSDFAAGMLKTRKSTTEKILNVLSVYENREISINDIEFEVSTENDIFDAAYEGIKEIIESIEDNTDGKE